MHANIDGQIDHYDHFRQHHTVRLDRSLPLSLCLYLCNFFSHRKENERIVAEKKEEEMNFNWTREEHGQKQYFAQMVE